jgi:hypothetical protein
MLHDPMIVRPLKKNGGTGRFWSDGQEIVTVIVVPMGAVSKLLGDIETVAFFVLRFFKNVSAVFLTKVVVLRGKRLVRTDS